MVTEVDNVIYNVVILNRNNIQTLKKGDLLRSSKNTAGKFYVEDIRINSDLALVINEQNIRFGYSIDEFINNYVYLKKVENEVIDKEISTILAEKNTKKNNVDHPEHYQVFKDKSGIEPIDIARHLDFDLGNAIKYILRAGNKGNAVEDLNKAIWYIKDKIKMLENEV